jgi:hypothetical protein
MAMTVDVHKHGVLNKKGIFMDSRVLTLGHSRQSENLSPQLLV